MLIVFLRWIVFAVSLSILLVYFKGGASIVQDIRRSVRTTGSYVSTLLILSMTLLGGVVLITQLLVCLGYWEVYAWAKVEWVACVGASLAIFGNLASYYCRYRYLKRFWKGNVELQPEHEIVDRGPYRVVRHPLYALATWMFLGVALLFATWWVLLCCLLTIIGYVLLAGYEDKFLSAKLTGYRAYQQRVRYRLLPGVW